MASKSHKNILQQKVPENPKYKHISPVVDTGASITKYNEILREIKKYYKYKKGEIFRRLKVTSLVSLIISVVENNDSSDGLESTKTESVTSPKSLISPSIKSYSSRPGSSMSFFAMGYGEMSPPTEKENTSADNLLVGSVSPFLLLDVRLTKEFNQSRIRSASNFPHTHLSRYHFETKEMRDYKNKPGKWIILYDEDESICPKVATVLVERGYDNVFLLSGGLVVAKKLFPSGLVLSHGGHPSMNGTSLDFDSITNDDILNLKEKLNEAKTFSSPVHRPMTKVMTKRRQTQIFAGQVKK